MALELLQVLLNVSERAATIARLIRGEKELFGLLVEEKKNDFFQHDYKTLADVLIQATVKYYVSKQFPQMSDHIKGEESCIFVNGVGERVNITLTDNINDTTKLLNAAFDSQKPHLAERLTNVIYNNDGKDIVISDEHRDKLRGVVIDTNQLGLWIDPIDGTNEYIKGHLTNPVNHIHDNGLQVSVVLIGIHDIISGAPVMGIVNQPFHVTDDYNNWKGRVIWGVATNQCKVACVPGRIIRDPLLPGVCLIGHVDTFATTPDWKVRCVSGCGYKFLCVIEGSADVFVLTVPSCYKWDTCGPQAILLALGGGIIAWEEFVNGKKEVPLVYHRPDDSSLDGPANVGGVIGYLNLERVHSFCKTVV